MNPQPAPCAHLPRRAEKRFPVSVSAKIAAAVPRSTSLDKRHVHTGFAPVCESLPLNAPVNLIQLLFAQTHGPTSSLQTPSLHAAPWLFEIGVCPLRSENELVLKIRRIVPAHPLDSGFAFDFPTQPAPAATTAAAGAIAGAPVSCHS